MAYSYKKIRKYSSDCHILEFNPSEYRLDATIGKHKKLERLSTINGEPNKDEYPIAKLNGGFFSMNGSTEFIGTYVDNGLYYQGSSYYYPTLVYWKENNKLEVELHPNQERCAYYQKNAYFAVGVPWTLVLDGKVNYSYTKQELIKNFTHPYQRHPRTLMGQKNDGTIVWVVVDGRRITSRGINIEESASLMKELGCRIAVNLDGGGSSEMIVNSKIVNKPSDGSERAIGTAFMAYAKIVNNATVKKGIVTADALNVRSGPGTSYGKVSLLKKNDVVNIIGEVNGWYKIDIKTETPVYVSKSYVKYQ